MTNQTILSILNNLCNEARDSVEATLGLIEFHRDTAAGATLRTCLETGRSSADRLLRSIDDVRDLLSGASLPGRAAEKFDVAHYLEDTVELLNLASGERATRISLQAPREPVTIRQDRQAVEQVLARILDAAIKLTLTGEVVTAIERGPGGNGIRLTVTPPNTSLAGDLIHWLNADPDRISMQDGNGVPFAIAVIVAGKRLRALGGTAGIGTGCRGIGGDTTCLTVYIPSQPEEIGNLNFPAHRPDTAPDALNILVAEDSDESYVLTEFLLEKENVCRARNGLEAVDIVKKHRFDVVFMDVHMPGMDGYTAVRAIRDWETQTANVRTSIVVLSSDDLETQQRSAAHSGCSGFLRKPLRNSDLVDLIHRLKATRTSLP
jgi:CheY-like chemotaxis protein